MTTPADNSNDVPSVLSAKVGPKAKIDYADTKPRTYNLGVVGNPLGFTPSIDSSLKEGGKQLTHSEYPKLSGELEKDLAGFYNLPTDHIYVGSKGAVGVIASVFESGLIPRGTLLLTPEAVFPAAAVEATNRGVAVARVKLNADFRMDFARLSREITAAKRNNKEVGAIFICNPNNPTGIAEPTSRIVTLAKENPKVLIIVSEANMELVNDEAMKRIGGSLLDDKNRPHLTPNLVVIRSFSKAYGLAGDRIGYAIGDPRVITRLSDGDVPFSIADDRVLRAQLALRDQDHVQETRKYVAKEVKKLMGALRELDFEVCQSDSAAILARVPDRMGGDALVLKEELEKRDCSVVAPGREFGERVDGKYIRIMPNTSEKNNHFVEVLREVCKSLEQSYYNSVVARVKEKTPFATFSEQHQPHLVP